MRTQSEFRGKFCFLVLILQSFCLLSAWSRPFSGNDHFPAAYQDATHNFPTSAVTLTPYEDAQKNQAKLEGEESSESMGSSPPSCEHKCYGCLPCEAIQVPVTSGRVGVQYTNYEPEGWKCKCGPAFYSP